jgi:hypothetical protein
MGGGKKFLCKGNDLFWDLGDFIYRLGVGSGLRRMRGKGQGLRFCLNWDLGDWIELWDGGMLRYRGAFIYPGR